MFIIFGSGSWRNNIEIPAKDQEFYALKMFRTGNFVNFIISPKQPILLATALFILLPVTTRILPNAILYSIYSMATAKAKAIEMLRDMQD